MYEISFNFNAPSNATGKELPRPKYSAFLASLYWWAIAFIMSIGDLSAIALFGSQEFRTLPLYLFQLLGSYQMEAAAVVSLSLLLLSVGVFSVVEWLFSSKKNHKGEL